MSYDPKNSPVTVLERLGFWLILSEDRPPKPIVWMWAEDWDQNPGLWRRMKVYMEEHKARILEELLTYWDDVDAGHRRPPPLGWPLCRRYKKCKPLCPERRGHFCP